MNHGTVPHHLLRSIQILLGHIPPNNDDPDHNDYYDLAMYLVVLHNYYLEHHNNPPVYVPHQTILERGPSVQNDLDLIVMDSADNLTRWQLKPELGLAITRGIFRVQHDLSHLDHIPLLPHVNPLHANPLFPSTFFLDGMHCIQTPMAVRKPSVFAALYPHCRQIFHHITETQLWVAFMPLLCNLLASARNSNNYEHFQPEYFRGCFLAVEAHNHYMESLEAPDEFYILTN